MNFLAEFHFLRPIWFLGFIPLAFIIWFIFRQSNISKQWEAIIEPELLPHILIGKLRQQTRYLESLVAVTGIIIITALAGPTWERLPQPVFKNESGLVIALDLSLSMLADDIQPSRYERARYEISDLLGKRQEGQTALLVYAGDAFTVTPLTDDIQTIRSQLVALSPNIMPAPGSNTGLALALATDLLEQSGYREGHILFVTDEISNRYETDIKAAVEKGYQISVLGIGTENGVPIKLDNGGFLEAPDGSIVIPKLDKTALKTIADIGKGDYQTSQIEDNDVERLQALFSNKKIDGEQQSSDLNSDQWYEVGPWLLLPLLPLLALGFRKGMLCVLACLILVQPEPAMAFDWTSLWKNKDQRGHDALQNNNSELAAELFNDPKWQAAAQYKSENYTEAEAIFSNQSDIQSRYNLANTLARLGRYEDAIKLYDDVIAEDAEHEDAIFNRDLLKQNMEQQQQESDSDNNDSNSDAEQRQQQQSQQQESDSQQQQSQQQGQAQPPQGEQQAKQQPQGQSEPEQGDQEQQENAEQQQDKEVTDEEQSQNQIAEMQDELDEGQQASEQWLRRIPDDPAGLLRRKFKYQYQQRDRAQTQENYW
ncbi:MAG: VWA domain-containing protein [Pseudomonadota bacterium]